MSSSNGNRPPLRVLFVESQAELGGAGFALLTMLRHLERKHVEPVHVTLAETCGEISSRVKAMGIPSLHIPAGRFRNISRAGRAVLSLARLIRWEQIDAVVTNSGHPLLFARPAAVMIGRPCAWWVHGYSPNDPLEGHAIALAQQFLGANALFANSEFTARMLRQGFPEHPAIRVVRPGVDLEASCPAPEAGARARQALGIASDEPVAGIFGRLQRWKGQHVFLQAAARLVSRGVPGRFLVVGDSMFGIEPEYAEELRRFVETSSLGDRVLFLGQRRDVNELMNACDVGVHASIEAEPWGLVVAEAMAAGRAVIASAAGGPLEMIDNGRTGLLVTPGEPSALAQAIEGLLNRTERRRSIGEAARQHARENFGAVRSAEIMSAGICEVSRRSGGRV